MPYIVGVHDTHDLRDLPNDVVRINLDTDSITVGYAGAGRCIGRRRAPSRPPEPCRRPQYRTTSLPQKLLRKLREKLSASGASHARSDGSWSANGAYSFGAGVHDARLAVRPSLTLLSPLVGPPASRSAYDLAYPDGILQLRLHHTVSLNGLRWRNMTPPIEDAKWIRDLSQPYGASCAPHTSPPCAFARLILSGKAPPTTVATARSRPWRAPALPARTRMRTGRRRDRRRPQRSLSTRQYRTPHPVPPQWSTRRKRRCPWARPPLLCRPPCRCRCPRCRHRRRLHHRLPQRTGPAYRPLALRRVRPSEWR